MSVKCLNLKDLYGKRYKIFMDESWQHEMDIELEKPWHYELHGRNGSAVVYPAGGDDLMVYVASPFTRNSMRMLKLEEKQCGEYESSFRFHASRLPEIDKVVCLRRRRSLTQDQKEKAATHLAKARLKLPKHCLVKQKEG